jgi:hypothetical protein
MAAGFVMYVQILYVMRRNTCIIISLIFHSSHCFSTIWNIYNSAEGSALFHRKGLPNQNGIILSSLKGKTCREVARQKWTNCVAASTRSRVKKGLINVCLASAWMYALAGTSLAEELVILF